MSLSARLRAADTRIERPARRVPQIGLNSSCVPGGTGSVALPGDIVIGDVRWTPDDGRCWHSTIGAALALEHHRAAS